MAHAIEDTEDMLAVRLEEQPMALAAGHAAFVPVTFAENRKTAERWLELLEGHNIPALIGDGRTELPGKLSGAAWLDRGVPVLVPEPLHELATEIIAQDDDMEEDDDLYEDDEELEDDDLDDLDDLDDDYDEEEDDDFDPDVEEEDLA